ncbi:MAG: lipoyl(octanoyl) transferase LipB [Sandaracinaceae bacterium]|nr:lipoyl(octanoyl) transferase LipB [Sandaracinaceae bacterium]
MPRRIRVHRLGLVPYAEAHELQERLQRARTRGAVPDTLLLLEHPKVITLGRGAKRENLLYAPERLAALGFEVHEIGRGGDVTYHGPGQLVGYPILDLAPDRKDVRRYVRDLEETMIQLAAAYGLRAGRIEGLNGTWIEDRKIGAVGVRISRWVTMHGFALNVTTDLDQFRVIVPCGIQGKGVTSLTRELDRAVPMDEAIDRLEAVFAEVFDATLEPSDAPPLAGIDPAAWAPEAWRDAPPV